MRGMKPQWIPTLVARDVRRVRKQARLVIEITPTGLHEYWNRRYKLNIIAIIGPGKAFGQHFSEALLCEIGIWRTRPYHAGKTPAKTGRRSNTKRRKWFQLTTEQYLAVAPLVFRHLQALVDQVVSNWKSPEGFYLNTDRNYFSRKKFKRFKTRKLQPRGCRFSVTLTDHLLVSDIYRAERNSENVRYQLVGLARFIDKVLARYRRDGHSIPFRHLKRVKELERVVQKRLYSMPPYLLADTLHYLPGGKNNLFWPELHELFHDVTGINGEIPAQKKLAQAALPGSKDRTGEITLRVMSELRPYRTSAELIVFELMPSPEVIAQAQSSSYSSKPPF